MHRDLRNKDNKLVTAYWALAGAGSALFASVAPVLADDGVWEKLGETLNSVYSKLVGLSTIVAVLMAVIALIIRMVSKNQRAVEEATQWIKRIVICWLAINGIGFILTTLQGLVTGGGVEFKADGEGGMKVVEAAVRPFLGI